jgi:hypothetical protein
MHSEIEVIYGRRILFFLLIGYKMEIFIQLARAATENPFNPENLLNPTLSNVCLVHLFYVSPPSHMTKKIHSKYEGLCERKLTFSNTSNSRNPSSHMAYRCLLKREQKTSTK